MKKETILFDLDLKKISKEDLELILEYERRFENFIETEKKLIEALDRLTQREESFANILKMIENYKNNIEGFYTNRNTIYTQIVNVYKEKYE